MHRSRSAAPTAFRRQSRHCSSPPSFDDKASASAAERQATKIVSSPQIVPMTWDKSLLSSATPTRCAEPGGVLITTRLAAGSTERTQLRKTDESRGEGSA